MMETALAASALNLDAKTQAKAGAAGDKAEAGETKVRFKDTLNKHIPGKQQQPQKAILLDSEDDNALLPDVSPDQLFDTAPEQVGSPLPAAVKKAMILIGQSMQKQAGDAVPASAEADAAPKPKIDVRVKDPKQPVKTANVPVLAEDKNENEKQTVVDAPDLARIKLKGGSLKNKAEGVSDKKSISEGADPAEATETPVRNALDLLQGRDAPVAAVVSDHRSTAEASDSAVPEDGHSGGMYRVSRADGKGGAIDIPAPADKTSMPEAPAAEVKINPVTVLDQRRYLAPAQDNSLAVINMISGNQEWVTAMQPESSLANAAVQAGGGKVVNTLKIQMHPVDLGLVTATMRLQGEELSVELKVENGTAYRQLKEDQNRIIDALKSHGFNVDHVNVVLAPDNTDAGNSSGNNMQNGQGNSGSAQQSQSRENTLGQSAGRGQGGGQGGYQQERSGNGRIVADEGRGDVGATGGAGAAGTGHIYL